MSQIQSNAFNFPEHILSGVDQRTGSFSVQIKMGNFHSHKGRGLQLPLTVSYSAMKTSDDGFGRGFSSLPVSYFNNEKSSISLSTGQAFEIVWNEKTQEYDIPYRKLKDIRVLYVDQTKEILVLFKDGHSEYLDYESGVINRYVSPQGLSIYFDFQYSQSQLLLWRMYDNDGGEVEIDWWTDKFKTTVTHKINHSVFQQFNFIKQGADKALKYFEMVGFETFTALKYQEFPDSQTKMITRLIHPSGLIEDLKYVNNHRLPEGAPIKYMPYVYQHVRYPGADQEPQVTDYSFSDHNFLGFGSDRNWIPGVDNLFYTPNDYQYSSTEIINNTKKTIRIYNKYHLTEEVLYYDEDTLLKKEDNIYYADLSVGIEEQPPQYSLLKEQRIIYYREDKTRTINIKTEYDEFANKIKEISADGSITEFTFYPKEGEHDACPPNPQNMVAFIKSEKFTPNINGYPPRETITKYGKMTSFETNKYFVVTKESIKHTGVILTTNYYDNIQQTNIYGRIKEKIENINGYESRNINNYLFSDSNYTKISTFITHDNLSSSITDTYDYNFHNIIKQINPENQVIEIEYDKLGRETKRTSHPDHPEYRAVNTTEYNVEPGNNWVKQTDVIGNIKTLKMNNAGKLLKVYMTFYNSSDPQLVSEKFYDAFGLKVIENEYDKVKNTVQYIQTKYEYDFHGQIKKIIHPDGRIETIEQNPIDLSVTHRQVGLLKMVTKYNLSQMEIEKYTYDDQKETLLVKTLISYDAYGNPIQTLDIDNNKSDLKFDKYDRITESIRYINDTPIVESYAYAPFSSADIPNKTYIDNIEIGSRIFDGLLRSTKEISAGVTHLYEYEGASSFPVKMIMPRGEIINAEYDQQLRLPIAIKVENTPSLNSAFEYNKKTGYIIKNINASATMTYEYDPLMRKIKQTVDTYDGNPLTTTSSYSMGGRLLNETGYKGDIKFIFFDKYLRPNKINSKENINADEDVTNITYDKYSRPIQFNFKVLPDKNQAYLYLELNSLGLETERNLIRNNITLFNIVQKFNKALLLEKKTLWEWSNEDDSQKVASIEEYSYDNLYRLTKYTCKNSNFPIDDYGNEITEQSFTHDKYANVTQVISTFTKETNGHSKNIQNFIYVQNNPVKLAKITNTHPTYPPAIIFYYDKAGNIVNDEHDRWYRFNALNQLDAIITRQHEYLSKYKYDGNGVLVSQEYQEGDITKFYYKQDQLENEVNGKKHTTYYELAPSVTKRQLKNEHSEIQQQQHLFGDSNETILGISVTSSSTPNFKLINYTPYGESNEKK